jgi:LysR family transcriptional regulator, regulator for metE and metH
MDLADLRLLDAVAVHGSFSAAAAQLRLSQPSVSARIAAVERTLGTALFTRDSRGARLTSAGHRYLGYVRRSLALLEEGRRAASAETADAVMRVGVPASYAAALTPALADAATACRLGLSVRAAHTSELLGDLYDERIDLALVSAGIVPVGFMSSHALSTTAVALAAAGVTAAGNHIRYAVHSWSDASERVISVLVGDGVARTRITVVSPAAAALSLAMYRGHVAVVPRLSAEPDINAGRLQLLELPLPRLTIELDWLHRVTPSEGSIHRFIHEFEMTGRP